MKLSDWRKEHWRLRTICADVIERQQLWKQLLADGPWEISKEEGQFSLATVKNGGVAYAHEGRWSMSTVAKEGEILYCYCWEQEELADIKKTVERATKSLLYPVTITGWQWVEVPGGDSQWMEIDVYSSSAARTPDRP